MSSDFTSLWIELDALLEQHAPRAHRNMRGPITEAGLAWLHSLASKGGVKHIDAALEATYRVHDGATGSRPSLLGLLPFPSEVEWAAQCAWHSSWISREELATWQSALGGDPLDGDEGDGELSWPSHWLPIGRDAGGNAVVASLRSGEIFAFDHEVGEPVSITILSEFLTALAAELRAGVIGEDDDGELTRNQARVSARAVTKRDYAEVLLALLVERNFVAIEPTESLRDAVRTALARRGPQRTQKLIALLYDHPDVTEVFAEDDVLAVVIDEFD